MSAAEIILIIIGIITIIVAIFAIINSHRDVEKSEYKKNQPKLNLSGKIPLSDIIMYTGEQLKWENTLSLKDRSSEKKIIKNYANQITKFEDYLLINLCPSEFSHNEIAYAVLAFNIFTITLAFTKNNVLVDYISSVKIKDTYVMHTNRNTFGKRVNLYDDKFILGQNKKIFEIPILYACIDGGPTAINLKKINELCNSDSRESINIATLDSEVQNYIKFVDMACLIECENTINEKPYEYSLHMEFNNRGKLIVDKAKFGHLAYEKFAKRAKQRSGEKVSTHAKKKK